MIKILKKINKYIFEEFINEYYLLLDHEIDANIGTLLDVGCGDSSKMERIAQRLKCSVGVDNYEPRLSQGAKNNIYTEYKKMDVLEIGKYFKPNSFDCVMASDVIEHLSKEDGRTLLEQMEKIARKKIIVFTPNGFLKQTAYDGNILQIHISGWEVDEMRNLGYRIIGVNGLKYLRGERTNIKWWPRPLWFRISLLSQLFVKNNPDLAFQIFCVKDKITRDC